MLDIRLREVGAKRPLNGTSKVNRWTDGQTHRRTDTQTDISTYRKHRPRGPMLWKWKGQCFGNLINIHLVSSKKKLIGSPNFLLRWREHCFHPLLIQLLSPYTKIYWIHWIEWIREAFMASLRKPVDFSHPRSLMPTVWNGPLRYFAPPLQIGHAHCADTHRAQLADWLSISRSTGDTPGTPEEVEFMEYLPGLIWLGQIICLAAVQVYTWHTSVQQQRSSAF